MPRIRGVSMEEAAPITRRLMEENQARFGHVFPGTAITGHAPTIQEGTQALNAGIANAGRISQQLRGLMNVRVANLVGCPF
jgi:hypothetical protein